MISILCMLTIRKEGEEILELVWPSPMSMAMARTIGYCILKKVIIIKEDYSNKRIYIKDW